MSLKSAPFSLQVPYNDKIANDDGLLTVAWQKFYQTLRSLIDPLGVEKAFALANNQVAAANIDNLSFSNYSCSFAKVFYGIQRVTTGGGAVENIETGVFYLAYKPTSNTWVLSSGPSTAGVTLSVTSAGQVQYTTTNIGGTASISKIVWRAQELAAKNQLYSKAGR